jgi:hypothetical protein
MPVDVQVGMVAVGCPWPQELKLASTWTGWLERPVGIVNLCVQVLHMGIGW